MATTIAQRELRNDNARIIDAVVAGEHFIVTRNGHAVAELHPVAPARRTFVRTRDLRAATRRAQTLDADTFRADLDAAIDQSL